MVDFYQHNIPDWEDGTKEMTFEQEAFYRKLCDQIYSFTDELPDDDHLVSRLTKLSVRKYRSLKKDLLLMGKIDIINSLIRNRRCTAEVTKILSISDLMREKQAKSVSKRRLNKENKKPNDGELSNENNETTVAGAIANSGTSDFPLLRNGHDEPKKTIQLGSEEYLFHRGKQVFGKSAGGLISKLLKSKAGLVADAIAAVELAAGKQNPCEWIGGALKHDGVNGQKRGFGEYHDIFYDPKHPAWKDLPFPGEDRRDTMKRLGFVPAVHTDKVLFHMLKPQDGFDQQPSPYSKGLM
jgi:uncharacterized protein YdaU (DUF1376 family)|tara:strand:- start:2107 stop:2994 length:888 start_codon:yes stop_codon:yes gene_type:complete